MSPWAKTDFIARAATSGNQSPRVGNWGKREKEQGNGRAYENKEEKEKQTILNESSLGFFSLDT